MRTAVFDLKDGYDSDAAKKASNYKPRIGPNSSSCNSNNKIKKQKLRRLYRTILPIRLDFQFYFGFYAGSSVNQSVPCLSGMGERGGEGGWGATEKDTESEKILHVT